MRSRITDEVSIVADGTSTPAVVEGTLEAFNANGVEVTGVKARRTAGSVLPPNMYLYTRTGQTGGAQYRVFCITPTGPDIDIVFPKGIDAENQDATIAPQLYFVIDNTQGDTSTWSVSLRTKIES